MRIPHGFDRRGFLRSAVLGGGAAALASGVLGQTAAAQPLAPITVDVKADCGAVGDGVTNDVASFQQAAQLLQAAGGGTLVIPPGVYIVGDQFHVSGETPYYQARDTFAVAGINGLTIQGNGATLRLEPGLRYGSFDPATGAPTDMPGTDSSYAAALNAMFRFTDCSNVTVNDLELDGDCDQLIIGGNSNIDIRADGLRFAQCTDVAVTDMHIHHQALDGIYIIRSNFAATDPATPHTLTRVVSEYNGRQGLSWIGGGGISAYDCKFNHTGRASVRTSPSAGLDIEQHPGSYSRDGHFENCEFINNFGIGAVSGLTTAVDVRFVNCVFWGTRYYSIWVQSPGFEFDDCKIYGTAPRAYGSTADPDAATRFVRCDFEDKPWTDGTVTRLGNYLFAANGDHISWTDCTFTANEVRSVYIEATGTAEEFHGCTFTHRSQGLVNGGAQALLVGSKLFNCHFTEDFPAGFPLSYKLNVTAAEVVAGEGDTIVDGPVVTWQGTTGVIPPGVY